MTREEAIEQLNAWAMRGYAVPVVAIHMAIEALQDRPTGKWIADVDKWGDVITTVEGYKCSECGEFNPCKDNFCPNCGVDMRMEGSE